MNEPKENPLKVGMDAFFTSERASEGVKIPLTDPLGRKTDHWLLIIGVDSEEFRLADAAAKRRASKLAIDKDGEEKDRAIMDLRRDLTATLVKGWSFDTPFSHAAVVDFFKKAPQIESSVDLAATRRALFFKNESEHS